MTSKLAVAALLYKSRFSLSLNNLLAQYSDARAFSANAAPSHALLQG